jgi:hypothetical protein
VPLAERLAPKEAIRRPRHPPSAGTALSIISYGVHSRASMLAHSDQRSATP